MQLRKKDLFIHEGVLSFRFTPEVGSIKTGHYRHAPLHPQLIELGVEKVFMEAPDGPMFFEPKKTTEEAHTAAQNVGDKITRWLACKEPSMRQSLLAQSTRQERRPTQATQHPNVP
jgi:hypothetical protein